MTARLGIIGGGQLSLYLCEAARALGLQVSVMAESADAPALKRADQTIVGELDDLRCLDKLLSCSDVITFDKEAIPNDTLAYLMQAQEDGRNTNYPGADILLMLKDKALQKTWLQQHNLPTLPFHILSDKDSSLGSLTEVFGGAVVQKSRCGGYDGRGVQILKSPESKKQMWDIPSIVEPYLADCHEISVVTARARCGAMQTYPPVSMEFDPQLNSVSMVSMPANISTGLAAAAVELAEQAVNLLEGVGVFAVEMFVTPQHELLINEISPRVHNSGHVTLDACNVSQFEQHVRAVAGLPLVEIESTAAAVMLNILYTDGLREHCPEDPAALRAGHSTSVYWYGKAPGIPGRKMGHINAVAPAVSSAAASAQHAMTQLSSPSDERAA